MKRTFIKKVEMRKITRGTARFIKGIAQWQNETKRKGMFAKKLVLQRGRKKPK